MLRPIDLGCLGKRCAASGRALVMQAHNVVCVAMVSVPGMCAAMWPSSMHHACIPACRAVCAREGRVAAITHRHTPVICLVCAATACGFCRACSHHSHRRTHAGTLRRGPRVAGQAHTHKDHTTEQMACVIGAAEVRAHALPLSARRVVRGVTLSSAARSRAPLVP